MNNSQSWNSVIFIQSVFFRIFFIFYNFKIIRAINMWSLAQITLTVYKFNRSRIPVFCKKWDGVLPSINELQLLVYGTVYKKSILYLVDRLLIFIIEYTSNSFIVSNNYRITWELPYRLVGLPRLYFTRFLESTSFPFLKATSFSFFMGPHFVKKRAKKILIALHLY